MAVIEQVDILNELKADLIQKIRETDDRELLGEIFCCIENHVPQEEFEFTEEFMNRLDEGLELGRKDCAEGRCVSNEELQKSSPNA